MNTKRANPFNAETTKILSTILDVQYQLIAGGDFPSSLADQGSAYGDEIEAE
jgi:hypothetical protein